MNAYTCGHATSRALSHKSTYTLNLFSVFHYLALMYKSDPPQSCYYISIFANIWYLIKLIHSIIIILRVFVFYKQRVLANFWGRKDSANCTSRKRRGACYCPVHIKWAINSLFMPTTYTLNLFSVFHYLALYVQVGPTSMLLLYQYFCQHLILD